MKTFQNPCAQGELDFEIAEIPPDAKPLKFDGPVIVGHSETGHHHLFAKNEGVQFFQTSNPFINYLRLEQPSLLEHTRPDHTAHESVSFPVGTYKVTSQAEYTPMGMRAVQD